MKKKPGHNDDGPEKTTKVIESIIYLCMFLIRGHAVAQFIEALRYKPERCRNFSLT
jgi:hypothetical protein